jgi:hypothetical protein
VRLAAIALVGPALLLCSTFAVSPGAWAQTVQRSKHHAKHKKTKHRATEAAAHPCLEGNWSVTSLTLSTSGLSFTGGVGTTVDILSNGNAVGNFTPGTPLTGSEGSAKFSGTLTDHYGFPSGTTALTGTFPVTPVSNNATITIAGVTRPVTSASEQGSYVCTGKNLSLTFPSGSSTLTYQLAPAG